MNVPNNSNTTTAKDIITGIIAEFRSSQRIQLPFHDRKFENTILDIIYELRDQAELDLKNGDVSAANEKLGIVGSLAPNHNTGLFSSFWQQILGRQPVYIGSVNPSYKAFVIKMGEEQAAAKIAELKPFYRELISRRTKQLIESE